MRHLKMILLIVIALAVVAGLALLPVRDWFTQLQGWIAQLGATGPIVLAAVYVVATVLLVPGSVLTIGAGTLFGLWVGSLTVLIGANLGALCSFLLSRTLLREEWRSGLKRIRNSPRWIGRLANRDSKWSFSRGSVRPSRLCCSITCSD